MAMVADLHLTEECTIGLGGCLCSPSALVAGIVFYIISNFGKSIGLAYLYAGGFPCTTAERSSPMTFSGSPQLHQMLWSQECCVLVGSAGPYLWRANNSGFLTGSTFQLALLREAREPFGWKALKLWLLLTGCLLAFDWVKDTWCLAINTGDRETSLITCWD